MAPIDPRLPLADSMIQEIDRSCVILSICISARRQKGNITCTKACASSLRTGCRTGRRSYERRCKCLSLDILLGSRHRQRPPMLQPCRRLRWKRQRGGGEVLSSLLIPLFHCILSTHPLLDLWTAIFRSRISRSATLMRDRNYQHCNLDRLAATVEVILILIWIWISTSNPLLPRTTLHSDKERTHSHSRDGKDGLRAEANRRVYWVRSWEIWKFVVNKHSRGWLYFMALVEAGQQLLSRTGYGKFCNWNGRFKMAGVFESSDGYIGSAFMDTWKAFGGILRYESSRQALFTRQHIISTTSSSSSSNS